MCCSLLHFSFLHDRFDSSVLPFCFCRCSSLWSCHLSTPSSQVLLQSKLMGNSSLGIVAHICVDHLVVGFFPDGDISCFWPHLDAGTSKWHTFAYWYLINARRTREITSIYIAYYHRRQDGAGHMNDVPLWRWQLSWRQPSTTTSAEFVMRGGAS